MNTSTFQNDLCTCKASPGPDSRPNVADLHPPTMKKDSAPVCSHAASGGSVHKHISHDLTDGGNLAVPEGLGMCGGVHTSHGLAHGAPRRPLTRALLKQHQQSPSQADPSISSFAAAADFQVHTPQSMLDNGAPSLQRSGSFPPAVKPQVPWRLISTHAQQEDELPNMEDLLRAASHLPAFPDVEVSQRLQGAIVSPAQGVIHEPIVHLQSQVEEPGCDAPTEVSLPDQGQNSAPRSSSATLPHSAAQVVGVTYLAALLALLCEGMPSLPPAQPVQMKAFLPDGSGTGSGSLEDSVEGKLERSSQESAGERVSSDEDLSAGAATSSAGNVRRSAATGSASSGGGHSDHRPATGNSEDGGGSSVEVSGSAEGSGEGSAEGSGEGSGSPLGLPSTTKTASLGTTTNATTKSLSVSSTSYNSSRSTSVRAKQAKGKRGQGSFASPSSVRALVLETHAAQMQLTQVQNAYADLSGRLMVLQEGMHDMKNMVAPHMQSGNTGYAHWKPRRTSLHCVPSTRSDTFSLPGSTPHSGNAPC